MKYYIKDWAGNDIYIPNKSFYFDSFDDAEEALSEFLDKEYDETRQEYVITFKGR